MRVVAVDMSGFGKAGELNYPYSVGDYAQEIKGVLDQIGEQKVDIIAHSFGARVAVKLANLDERINRIIFTGAAGLKPRRGFKYLLRKASFFILKNFVPKQKLTFLYAKDYQGLTPIMKESFKKIIAENLDEEYKKLKNKTLLIFGANDKETPPYMARQMKRLVKDSQLVFIAGAGHFCFISNSDEFNSLAFRFLIGGSIN